MARLSRSAWLVAALAGLCVILALVVWMELSVEPRAVSRQTSAVPPQGEAEFHQPEDMTIAFARLQDYEEIVRRPLFSTTRRPEEPDKPKVIPNASKVSAPAADSLIVLGIVISPETTIAVVQDKKTKKIVKAAQGTNINGWEVTEIREDGVTIRLGERETTLMLHRPDDKKPTAPKRKPKRRARGGLADARAGR